MLLIYLLQFSVYLTCCSRVLHATPNFPIRTKGKGDGKNEQKKKGAGAGYQVSCHGSDVLLSSTSENRQSGNSIEQYKKEGN